MKKKILFLVVALLLGMIVNAQTRLGTEQNQIAAPKNFETIPKTVVPCEPPENVDIMLALCYCCFVEVVWDEPENGSGIYNIYRDDKLVSEGVQNVFGGHTDYGVPSGTHTWCVATVCDDVESEKICLTKDVGLYGQVLMVAHGGGRIDPMREGVNCGSDFTVTFTADEGHHLDSVIINGKNDHDAAVAGMHTFGNTFGFAVVAYFSPNQSIGEQELTATSIFPNPASTQVFVETEQLEKIEIYNLQGQLLETISGLEGSKNATVNVTKYDAGVYFFKIHAAGTNKTQRVVITR